MVISVASGKGSTGKTMVEYPNGETKAAVAGLSENFAESQWYEVVTGVAEEPNRHPGKCRAWRTRESN